MFCNYLLPSLFTRVNEAIPQCNKIPAFKFYDWEKILKYVPQADLESKKKVFIMKNGPTTVTT